MKSSERSAPVAASGTGDADALQTCSPLLLYSTIYPRGRRQGPEALFVVVVVVIMFNAAVVVAVVAVDVVVLVCCC